MAPFGGKAQGQIAHLVVSKVQADGISGLQLHRQDFAAADGLVAQHRLQILRLLDKCFITAHRNPPLQHTIYNSRQL